MTICNLDEFDDAYDDAEVPKNDFSPVPDGTYQAIIDEVELKETKTTGMPMLSWKLRIVSKPQTGRFLFKNSVIKAETIGYLKADLSLCGLELDKFSTLESKLEHLLDVGLEVKVVNKKGKLDDTGKPTINTNVYFQKRIEIDVSGSDQVEADDIPF